MRPGRCLGMALKAECGLVCPGQALQRAVKQTDVGDAQMLWQAGHVNREAVILAGNADPARVQIFDRVIGAVVALLHFEGFDTCCQSHELVPEANAKNGNASFNQFAHSGNRVVARLRVTRAVRQKDPIRFELEYVSR